MEVGGRGFAEWSERLRIVTVTSNATPEFLEPWDSTVQTFWPFLEMVRKVTSLARPGDLIREKRGFGFEWKPHRIVLLLASLWYVAGIRPSRRRTDLAPKNGVA